MKINGISKSLCTIVTAVLLTGFKEPTTAPKASHKGIWSIPTGFGINWKPKSEATNNAWMGFVAITGIKWEK